MKQGKALPCGPAPAVSQERKSIGDSEKATVNTLRLTFYQFRLTFPSSSCCVAAPIPISQSASSERGKPRLRALEVLELQILPITAVQHSTHTHRIQKVPVELLVLVDEAPFEGRRWLVVPGTLTRGPTRLPAPRCSGREGKVWPSVYPVELFQETRMNSFWTISGSVNP